MNLIKYQLKMLTWMDYVAFNRILITELDGMTLLKTTQTYRAQMKKFEVRGQNENTTTLLCSFVLTIGSCNNNGSD